MLKPCLISQIDIQFTMLVSHRLANVVPLLCACLVGCVALLRILLAAMPCTHSPDAARPWLRMIRSDLDMLCMPPGSIIDRGALWPMSAEHEQSPTHDCRIRSAAKWCLPAQAHQQLPCQYVGHAFVGSCSAALMKLGTPTRRASQHARLRQPFLLGGWRDFVLATPSACAPRARARARGRRFGGRCGRGMGRGRPSSPGVGRESGTRCLNITGLPTSGRAAGGCTLTSPRGCSVGSASPLTSAAARAGSGRRRGRRSGKQSGGGARYRHGPGRRLRSAAQGGPRRRRGS